MFSLYFKLGYKYKYDSGGGAMGQIVGPESGMLGVRITAATDLSRKNRL